MRQLPWLWCIGVGLALLLGLAQPARAAGTGSVDDSSGGRVIEPGVLDVQAWDWLSQDLERMIDQTQPQARSRLSPEAFEARYVGATVEFLELDPKAARAFQGAVDKALGEIDRARYAMQSRKAELEPGRSETDAMREASAGWETYRKVQLDSVHYPLAALEAQPRHQLLREQILAWLLRLDYGMSVAGR